MEDKSKDNCFRRKNAECWKLDVDNWMDGWNNNTQNEFANGLGKEKQSKMRPGQDSPESQSEISSVEKSSQIFRPRLSQTISSQHPKRYNRTQSETNVSSRLVANSAKLKRVFSATEIRTRLAGCPKGLLIATEPPKAGESYRRRSNTDVKAAFGKNVDFRFHDREMINGHADQENASLEQEKEVILSELEAVKNERQQLQQENEGLRQELENRNKVIDHLIDFMKSSMPGEAQQFGDDVNETITNNNIKRTHSFERV